MRLFYLVVLVSFTACNSHESTFEKILSNGSSNFQKVLHSPKHEVQIIYGEIRNDTIVHHYFGDTGAYFYPASSIKMLNAFAMVQWLNENEFELDARLFLDSSLHHPRRLLYDSLFADSIQVANLLRKIFVFSDNQASNILFNFLGKDYINTLYDEIDIPTRVVHQLGENAYSFSPASNNWTSASTIYNDQQTQSFESSQQNFTSSLKPSNQIKGRGFIDKDGQLTEQGFDFSSKNYVPLAHLLGALERIVSPEILDSKKPFTLNINFRDQLLDIMALRPKDLPYPIDTLADNYVKFLMLGDQENTSYPSTLTILNKVGWAYGYLTDVAFIHDAENDVSFFLAATIHVNNNEIYNDGIYEYEEIGLPFLGELGRLVYTYELEKKATYK